MKIYSGVSVWAVSFLVVLFFVSGCASSGASKIKDGALELVGLMKPEEKPVVETAKPVRLQIYAGTNLNSDGRGRPMSVVFKFYRLRDPAAFMQAPYELLADGQQEKTALSNDLLEIKELVVMPGQEVVRTELLGGETPYLGVVALFRKPYPDRWRLVFANEQKVNANGIVLGAHACALSVSKGVPFNAQLVNASSLGGVLCR